MGGGTRNVAISTIWECAAKVLYGQGASREMTEKGKSLARMRPLSRLGPFGVRAGRTENNLALTVAPRAVVLAGAKLFRAIFMRLVGFYCVDGSSPGWLGNERNMFLWSLQAAAILVSAGACRLSSISTARHN